MITNLLLGAAMTSPIVPNDLSYLHRLYSSTYIASQDRFYGEKVKRRHLELMQSGTSLSDSLRRVHYEFPDSHFSLIKEGGQKVRAQHPKMMLGFGECTIRPNAFQFTSRCLVFLDPQASLPPGYNEFEGDLLPKNYDNSSAPRIVEESESYLRVRIPLMRGSLLAEEKEIIQRLENSSSKKVVIDLRGNGGGSDELPLAIAQAIRSNEWIERQSWKGIRIHSHLAREGFVATLEEIVQSYPDAGYEPILEKFKLELIERANEAQYISEDDYTSLTVNPNQSYIPPSKIVFLVDRHCASACEIVLALFHKDPNVVIIGSHSAGRFWFGNMGTFVLPESGITVKLGSFAHSFQYSPPEMIGFSPTVFADSAEHLETLLSEVLAKP